MGAAAASCSDASNVVSSIYCLNSFLLLRLSRSPALQFSSADRWENLQQSESKMRRMQMIMITRQRYYLSTSYDLYLKAKSGNLDDFKIVLRDHDLFKVSPIGNTLLHVAARHGNADVAAFIAAKDSSLLSCKNFAGETALHLAAKMGAESTVRVLVNSHQESSQRDQNEGGERYFLRERNERGNTALHEALFNSHCLIAEYLINEDSELLYFQNNVGEFALNLAAKAGFVNCVSSILVRYEERLNDQFRKKSPIQAAIRGKHRDVLEVMFKSNPSLIRIRDEEGRNPLHHAALFGNIEMARYLLDLCPNNATRRDKSSSFPIHLASMEGHVDVVRVLLQAGCPDPGELLNNINGYSFLHVAAENGRSNVVRLVLKNPDLEHLINMKDICGNTSLHVAAKFFQAKVVSTLTWDKRVDIHAFNEDGMSALDHFAVQPTNPSSTPFSQILTWAALKAAGTPQYLPGNNGGRRMISSMVNDKDIIGTLLLVSAFVATVTYDAGFNVPGGYNNSESEGNVGMATMLLDKGFHVFIFCDSLAMYCSLAVAVALILAQFGGPPLVLNALILAVPFLGIALTMMSMAFTAGLFLAVSKLSWLSKAVLAMGVVFLVILFLLLLPLCTPITSRNRVLRYVSYYPFCLLILTSSCCC